MSAATALSVCEAGAGVLIVSPSGDVRNNLTARVKSDRWRLREAVSGAHALDQLESDDFELLLLDPALPDLNAREFESLVRSQFPHIQVLVLDQQTGLPHPLAAKLPINDDVPMTLGQTAPLMPARVQEPVRQPLSDRTSSAPLPGMIGDSPAMQRVYHLTELVARRDTTVLITGQSGTGKDLVAQAVHTLSPRRNNPFIVINCAAIPEPLLEAELFGYTKGAFTGAVQSRIGRIHAAQGGTLFLDEIGELPLGLQSKLLRFLEQGEVQRLGSSDSFRVDVRVVAATNINLRQLVEEQKFREDLYYRLAIFPIELPLLKDRMEDLPALASTFLAKFSSHRLSLSSEASFMLLQHHWRGNVRELRNVIERATILAQDDRQVLGKHISL
jgi:DNA-binding NtrC family response regulator